MIQLSNIRDKKAENAFFAALCSRLDNNFKNHLGDLYSIISRLPNISGDYENGSPAINQTWLKDFILSNFNTLREWTKNYDCVLKSSNIFKDIYTDYFSKGPNVYLNTEKTYNAYDFLKNLKISVCPYCEDEYIDVIINNDGANIIRTAELDHFFPKSEYPLLAMSYYNLIPSGKNCNHIKKSKNIGMCPYEEEIETKTYLYPDIPVGINFESISPDQCAVKFHAKGEMKKNISVLHLEERYEHTKNIVRDILKNKQQFCPELLHALPQEMQDKILRSLFDTPDESEKYHELHVKLRKDVAHYYDENF